MATSEIRAETLWELIVARAEATPDALFGLDESGRQMTFAEYRDAAERMAGFLVKKGVGEGTCVSWILPTGYNAVVVLAALSRLGAVQNPIIPIYRSREVRHCLRQTGARMLIVPHEFRGFGYEAMARELAGEISGLEVVVAPEGYWVDELPEDDGSALPPVAASRTGDEIRWIFYTSGTTSDPKGARHSDAGFLASSFGLADAMGLEASDRIALVFPVTHLGGVNSLVAALCRGAGHLIVETFNPPQTIPFLRAHGVTHAGAGTAFHRMYLEVQRQNSGEPLFPKVKVFQGGGAPKPPTLHFELLEECGGPLISCYGMTECPIISLGRLGDPDSMLAETEGRLNVEGTELRVVKSDGSLAGPGEEGELRVRAPQLFHGYVDEALNAAAFDEDGFYRTGDLGIVSADGYLTISGRIKDVIIRKGENISALEIEDLLLQHPKVADVAVIGLPDEERGEMVCAVVKNRDSGAPLAFDEMTGFLREKELMVQKIPERLECLDELPRNPTGKLLKRVLQEQFG